MAQSQENYPEKTFSSQVRATISSIKPQSVIAKPRQWLTNYFMIMHQTMRASVPLMRAAVNQLTNHDGELSRLLSDYYSTHSIEETDHDEWLLDDLDSIGISRGDVLNKKPSNTIAELVGAQYYWIYHYHPVILLGYIGVIEGNPPKKENIYRLQELTGFPDSAFRTMLKHSDLDVKHKADLDALFDSLPLDLDHKRWVLENASYTIKKLRTLTSPYKPADDI